MIFWWLCIAGGVVTAGLVMWMAWEKHVEKKKWNQGYCEICSKCWKPWAYQKNQIIYRCCCEGHMFSVWYTSTDGIRRSYSSW